MTQPGYFTRCSDDDVFDTNIVNESCVEYCERDIEI